MGADVAGIPRDGNRSCGNPAVMEFVCAGTPLGRFGNFSHDKNSGASVRILGKLSREVSYVAARFVVDS